MDKRYFLIARCIRRDLKKKIKKDCYCAREVFWMINNLSPSSRSLTLTTVAHYLSKTKTAINPQKYDIDIHGLYNILFYPKEVIWEYLQLMEKQGVIKLKGNGIKIKNFSDIVKKKFYEEPAFKGSSFTGFGGVWKGRPEDCSEGSPSWDNSIKQIEE